MHQDTMFCTTKKNTKQNFSAELGKVPSHPFCFHRDSFCFDCQVLSSCASCSCVPAYLHMVLLLDDFNYSCEVPRTSDYENVNTKDHVHVYTHDFHKNTSMFSLYHEAIHQCPMEQYMSKNGSCLDSSDLRAISNLWATLPTFPDVRTRTDHDTTDKMNVSHEAQNKNKEMKETGTKRENEPTPLHCLLPDTLQNAVDNMNFAACAIDDDDINTYEFNPFVPHITLPICSNIDIAPLVYKHDSHLTLIRRHPRHDTSKGHPFGFQKGAKHMSKGHPRRSQKGANRSEVGETLGTLHETSNVLDICAHNFVVSHKLLQTTAFMDKGEVNVLNVKEKTC